MVNSAVQSSAQTVQTEPGKTKLLDLNEQRKINKIMKSFSVEDIDNILDNVAVEQWIKETDDNFDLVEKPKHGG